MAKKASVLLVKIAGRQCHRKLSTEARLSTAEAIARRNALFSEEKARQAALVTRVQKIKVKYNGLPEPCTMVMNKDISTPFDCAKHLSEHIRQSAVIAYVNGQPWDMHSPLREDCQLELAHFKDPSEAKIKMVNKVFWRTCSFLMGYTAERSFKDVHQVTLHSWPAPSIRSGSFVCDAALSLQNWTPTDAELRILSAAVRRLALDRLAFERLEVDATVARNIFSHNRFKHEQVEQVAAQSDAGRVTLYRCGDHVDMSRGPMVANSGQVGLFDVASVHAFDTPVGLMHRFQGVAHPSAFTISPFAHNVLMQRARAMNTTGLPQEATVTLAEAEVTLAREVKFAEKDFAEDDHHQQHQPSQERQAAQ